MFGGFVAPMSGPQGGWEPIDNAWVYDPATDSWRNLAPMPIKRGSAAANIVNGKVYVMGGATTAEGSKDVAISNATTANNLTRNDVYDIASNTWSSGAPMALARNHMFSGTVNGKIYIIGGRIAHAFVAASQNTDVVEQYDPATNTWGAQMAKMPTRAAAAAGQPTAARSMSPAARWRPIRSSGPSARSRHSILRPTVGRSCRRCPCRGTASPGR